tara:strand:+ start:372 stop:866 length:495 start_codon:yes stop_codon:yes gene_type:complete
MKKSSNTPIERFKYLLKGSESAKYSSIILILLSGFLIYKMRDHIAYLVPLFIGVVLLIAYTINNLWLKNYNLTEENIQLQLKKYKLHLAKREKYEVTIMFIWILTATPAYLYGKEIDLFVLLRFMTLTYLFILIGNILFKKTKNQVNELEVQANNSEETNPSHT